ncbi:MULTISPECIES: 60S ribosomal export protein NMD3 [Methanoculleus]|jgi:nonsense-mediated mRNA decay protein 3|uniref:Nonsense-mediated mRNA decay protein 3 n=1 Tax=Methanoculleus thermophilus TaxID=2200 RepID=A0A1G8YU42_9EURY|nr:MULTISPECIES: 60S ribosomal export protein NMD3 [Methanoculleus]NLN08090.1 NMD protein affecting ribosome stability and mRNA decay [Methanoculleus thermophilus]SDK05595.1 nonsense-mediated mRNA decay protein 3 [Methanoculleus thermophilus]HQD26080.1 60S ribosomal export protein NMD3 [Methanoculleus thermophilus]
MTIQTSICPRCGQPTEEGLCPQCRAADVRLLTCQPRVTAVYCPVCDSQKRGKTWSDLQMPREDLIAELAVSATSIHEDAKDIRVTVRSQETGPNRTTCTVEVEATMYGVPVKETCETEIIWQKESCDRCSRISGGYYEGIVQVRATNRKINAYEREVAARIAEQVEESLQQSGDRFSFISDLQDTKDGVDITVGTQHLGLEISRMITGALGGRFTTHPKLVGEKEGRALYRITYSIRLPFYQKGDVVVARGGYFEVREIDGQRLRVFDLQNGTARTLTEDEVERLIGNVREAESALVVFTQPGAVGLMDPKTYQTKEVNAVPWTFPVEGQPIRVLRDEVEDRLVIVG